MHARELIHLGALIASHGSLLIQGPGRITLSGLEQYWAAAKARHDRWGHALKKYQGKRNRDAAARTAAWAEFLPVLQEILTGDVLIRVWTAVACGHERRQPSGDVEPLVRNVLTGQIEARHRVLNLMVYGQGVGMHEAVLLNRL